MQTEDSTSALDAFLDQFDFKAICTADPHKELGVHLPLPKGYPTKYRKIQKMSEKKFGKLLQRIMVAAIDRAAVITGVDGEVEPQPLKSA